MGLNFEARVNLLNESLHGLMTNYWDWDYLKGAINRGYSVPNPIADNQVGRVMKSAVNLTVNNVNDFYDATRERHPELLDPQRDKEEEIKYQLYLLWFNCPYFRTTFSNAVREALRHLTNSDVGEVVRVFMANN